MAGIMDNMGDMDTMKARYEELKIKDQTGQLDDSGRAELDQLRSHFEKE